MGDFVQATNGGNRITSGFLPNEAGPLVSTGWETAQTYARTAFDDAMSLIERLEAIGGQLADIPDVSAEVAPVAHGISGFVMPDTPERPDLSTQFPAAPASPTLGEVAAITLPDAPEFVQGTPSGVMSYLDPGYESALLNDMTAFLDEWVNGVATGLDPAVEAALWNRARAREDVTAIRACDTVRSNMAGRGFSSPPGAMAVALLAATQDAIDKTSSVSRDIAIKQADLEQTNRHFAVTAGIQLEEKLIAYANQKAQRIFEVAAANLRASIDLFQTAATVYSARTQGYMALAQAKIAVQAADIKINKEMPLEVFKSQVTAFDSLVRSEAERLRAISTVYEADGRVYSSSAQAEGSKAAAEADIYRAEVQLVIGAANVQVEVAKATVAKMTSAIGLLTDSIKAGAQVSAQLAAASLSSVNLSGSISSGNSYSSSTSVSDSYSTGQTLHNNLSETHSYDETKK